MPTLKMSLLRNAVQITCIIDKLIITHQEPIEGIKVWIWLGYRCNILGYQSKYCNCTSKKKLGQFPHSPWATQVDNFFNTGKPLLTRFLLRQIRFNTNYNLQPCPPIARLNFDLTRYFKIKCGQKQDPHPSNTCHTVQYSLVHVRYKASTLQ